MQTPQQIFPGEWEEFFNGKWIKIKSQGRLMTINEFNRNVINAEKILIRNTNTENSMESQYKCNDCQNTFNDSQAIKDYNGDLCPKCHSGDILTTKKELTLPDKEDGLTIQKNIRNLLFVRPFDIEKIESAAIKLCDYIINSTNENS